MGDWATYFVKAPPAPQSLQIPIPPPPSCGGGTPHLFPTTPLSLIQSCDYTLKEGKIGKPEHLRCDSCSKVWRRLSWNPCTPLVFKSSLLVPSSPHGSKVSKYHTFEKRPLKPDLSFALPYFKGIVLCVCSKKVKRIFNDIKIWWKQARTRWKLKIPSKWKRFSWNIEQVQCFVNWLLLHYTISNFVNRDRFEGGVHICKCQCNL